MKKGGYEIEDGYLTINNGQEIRIGKCYVKSSGEYKKTNWEDLKNGKNFYIKCDQNLGKNYSWHFRYILDA